MDSYIAQVVCTVHDGKGIPYTQCHAVFNVSVPIKLNRSKHTTMYICRGLESLVNKQLAIVKLNA